MNGCGPSWSQTEAEIGSAAALMDSGFSVYGTSKDSVGASKYGERTGYWIKEAFGA